MFDVDDSATFAELLVAQMECFQSIVRSYGNFVKLADKTSSKVKTHLSYIQTNWSHARKMHFRLKAIAGKDDENNAYFTENQFGTQEMSLLEMLSDLEAALAATVPAPPLKTSTPHDDNACNFPLLNASSLIASQGLQHLPPINLPPFNGEFDKWDSFRDYFESIIVKDCHVDNLRKLHYLKSCLTGEPLSMIDHLNLTQENFDNAWQLLKSHFDNNCKVKEQLFKALFAIPTLTKESSAGLRELHSSLSAVLGSLQAKGEPVQEWSSLLVYFVTQKLDPTTRKAWSLSAGTQNEFPKFDDLKKFILNRATGLSSFNPTNTNAGSSSTHKQQTSCNKTQTKHTTSQVSTHTVSTQQPKCVFCSDEHHIYKCAKFKELDVAKRFEFAKSKWLCTNCLGSHKLNECKSKYDCNVCHKRHHTMLHRSRTPVDQPSSNQDNNSNLKSPSDNSKVTLPNDKTEVLLIMPKSESAPRTAQIILATATVLVHAENGRSVKVRALIDPASTWTLVTETLANSLNARKVKTSTHVSGVGGRSAGHVTSAASIGISPVKSSSPLLHTHAIILKKLCNYTPRAESSLSQWPHLKNLPLADSNPFSDEPISVIIGADLYGLIILEGLIKGEPDQPIAQNTVFGWILSGWTTSLTSSSPSITNTFVSLAEDFENDIESRLDTALTRFWQLEEIPSSESSTDEDALCESHFTQTFERQADGRYIVRLPFRASPPPIGQTREIALQCFLSLERRLARNPADYESYRNFMLDYEKQGHMTLVPADQQSTFFSNYFPHHAVKKPSSTTTKLRVVFNASSRSSNGTSLNDHLYSGPKLQANLVSVLIEWRFPRIVATADIAQMYRQIIVAPEDRDFQRIFWRPSSDLPLQEYRLNTVTFGVSCAPFLALRVLQQLKQDDGARFPLAARVLEHGLYVDDNLFGADDVQGAKQIKDQLIKLLAGGGFILRKWASNSPELLAEIDPSNHGLAFEKTLQEGDGIKLLGMFWCPSSDSFQFRISMLDIPAPTKRLVLSVIARIFDPLGLVSPVIVTAKILLQSLWKLKIDWDMSLPADILARWNAFYNSLPYLDQVKVPRWFQLSPDVLSYELHAFCDASLHAYAATAYLRVQLANNEVYTSLVMSKTRVAPTKVPKSFATPELTIPRLELCGALLLTDLINYLKTIPSFENIPITCWTDATIVLGWLRKPPSQSHTFISNRVQAILKITTAEQWRHVPTVHNPADIASRGITADKLVNSSLWFEGPSWLRESPEQWPSLDSSNQVTALACTDGNENPFDRLTKCISSWQRILRVTAYLLRWSPGRPRSYSLIPDASEIKYARLCWYRWLQAQLFPQELKCLKNNQPVPNSSPLSRLFPFLDGNSLIRVTGRLEHAELDYDTRHPIVLCNHPAVRLMVRDAHHRCLHGDISRTLSKLRQSVWILQAKKLIRSVIFHCVPCTRLKAETATQLMGTLPDPRVIRHARPFLHTGVDYAGPIQVRPHDGPGYKSHPAYIAIFVCFGVKAIHLELVGDYSTNTFLLAFKRFVSRRGLPSDMYSDNAKNFEGACNDLQRAYRAAIANPELAQYLANDQVTWHFIPPAAPHFGGLWEAGVKSVKHHLRRILNDRTPSYQEITTLLCEIEACLNSRPLAPHTEAVDGLDVLTPSHFLIGSAATAIPSPSLLDFSERSLTRWQLYRQLLESFWKHWSADYLLSLQHRSKWLRPEENVKVGQIVLIKLPDLPPTKWPLARVIRCFPGSDNLVRAVQVSTEKSVYDRPIAKIVVLPVNEFITPHLC